jgi:hypothetical protein
MNLFSNQRKGSRHPTVRMLLRVNEGEDEYFARLVDLSRQGIGFASDQEFAIGSRCEVGLSIVEYMPMIDEDDEEPLPESVDLFVDAVVRWCRRRETPGLGYYNYGCEFVGMGEMHSERLTRVLDAFSSRLVQL